MGIILEEVATNLKKQLRLTKNIKPLFNRLTEKTTYRHLKN